LVKSRKEGTDSSPFLRGLPGRGERLINVPPGGIVFTNKLYIGELLLPFALCTVNGFSCTVFPDGKNEDYTVFLIGFGLAEAKNDFRLPFKKGAPPQTNAVF